MEENKDENIKKLGAALNKSIIHYEGTRNMYAISEVELENINSLGNDIWKDIGIAAFAMGTPCIINAISIHLNKSEEELVITIDIFLNCLFGLLGIIIGAIFITIWYSGSKKKEKMIEKIKKRQKYEL